jgi:hypothetical protein
VDKSLFIKEIIDNSIRAIIITRPRRWGKTLNLDMLKTFLEITVDELGNYDLKSRNENYGLFAGD